MYSVDTGYPRSNSLNTEQINEQNVSVVFDKRHYSLSQSLAKKIHFTVYLTNITVQQLTVSLTNDQQYSFKQP